MAEAVLLTQEGFNELEAERDELVSVRRKEVAARLKEAISYGDLSENAEYDAAKNEQAELEERILKLEAMIRNAKIINQDDVGIDKVNVGLEVKVRDLDENEDIDYVIVGITQSDPFAEPAKVSTDSENGKALLGQSVGDGVELSVPDGFIRYEIKHIKRA